MAANFRSISQAAPTAGGDWSFVFGSGLGTPKAVVFLITKFTDADFSPATWVDGAMMSVGFTDGVRNRAFSNAVKNIAILGTDVWSRGSATRCVQAIDEASGAIVFDAHFKQWDAQGFTLTVDTPAAGAPQQYIVAAACFFGDWEVWAGTCDSSASTITDPGFRPDVVLFAGGGALVLDDTAYPAPAQFSFGFANRYPLSNHSRMWAPDTDIFSANNVWEYVANARCFNLYSRTAVVDDLYVTEFTSNGWTQAGTVAGSELCVLAIRRTSPGPSDIGALTYTTPTTTGNQIVTGFGGVPIGLFNTFGKAVNLNTIILGAVAEPFGIGWVDDLGSQICAAVRMKNDFSTAQSLMQNRLVDIQRTTIPTGRYAGDWVSYNADGFTWNSTASGGTPYWQTLALGSAAHPERRYPRGVMRGVMRGVR